MRIIALLLICFVSFNICFPQNQNILDSLEDELIFRQESYGNDSGVVRILKELSIVAFSENTTLSIEYAAQLLSITNEKLKDSILIGDANEFIGDAYFKNSKFYLAMEHYLKAYKIFYSHDKRSRAAFLMTKIGDTYHAQDIDIKARDSYQSALSLYRALSDKNGEAHARRKMGEYYLNQDMGEIALKDFKAALEIYEKTNNQDQKAEIFLELSKTYLSLEQFDLALEEANNALIAYKNNQNKVLLAETYYLLGQIYSGRKNISLSIENFMKALSLFQTNNETARIIQIYFLVGRTYFGQKNFPQALDNANLALKYANQNNCLPCKKDLYILISKIYLAKADYKTAYDYFESADYIKDSIIDESKRLQFYELQVSLEVQKQQAELENLRTEIRNQRLEIKNRNIHTIILVVVIIFVLAAATMFYLRYKEKSKAEKKLLDKSIEISKQRNAIEHVMNKLAEREQQLLEANFAKDKMFSIIGHDLRNPIGNLKDLLEILTNESESFDQSTYNDILHNLKKTAISAFNLLQNLLIWATAQKGEINFAPIDFSLRDIIEENMELMSINAKNKSIILNSTVNDGLRIYADKNMISTVIRNILANAIKFTPDNGQVTISAASDNILHNIGNAKFVEVSIMDTGIGIPPENMDKIFNQNCNFSTYDTSDQKGWGLGLKLCMEFVHRNGGKIWVESIPDKGSTFKFIVPRSNISGLRIDDDELE